MWRFLSGLLLGFVLGAAAFALLSSHEPKPPPVQPFPTEEPTSGDGIGVADSAAGPPSREESTAARTAPQDPGSREPDVAEIVRRIDGGKTLTDDQLDRLTGRGGRARRSNVKITPGLVEQLLSSGSDYRRKLGASLATRANPPPLQTLRRLATSDPVADVRGKSLRALVWLRRQVSDCMQICMAAARDESAHVRIQAIKGLGTFARDAPEAAAIIVAATLDAHDFVRRAAISRLSRAGPAGAQRAAELIFTEKYDSETAEHLAEAVVEGGMLPQVLDRGVGPEYVTPMLMEVEDYQAKVLAGRFERLLPLFQPEESESYLHFFSLAAEARESGFLSGVVLSGKHPWEIRSSAIWAGIRNDATRPTLVESALSLMRNYEAQPRLRLRIVHLLPEEIEDDDPLWPTVERALFDAARNDPSPWIRESARDALGLEDED